MQDFPWSSKEQGMLLSSFFYGYIFTQLPGGWLAPRIGAARLYGLGILSTAVLTLLTPTIANAGLYPLIAIRVLEGIFEVLYYGYNNYYYNNNFKQIFRE